MSGSDSEYSFSYNPEFFNFPQKTKDKLSNILLDGLMDLSDIKEINGMTLIRYNGDQPLIFSMNPEHFEYLKTLGETIASLEPASYFKDLTREFEYRGEGHIDLDDFDLFLAKLDDDLLIGILSGDTTARLFQISQKFANRIHDVINQKEEKKLVLKKKEETKSSETVRITENKAEDKPKKEKTKSKSDLKNDLRSRLDSLND